MNKLIAAVLVLLTAFAVAGCGAKASHESNEIANPWTAWDTLKEAEEAAGFSFGLPESIEGSYVARDFRTMDADVKLIEVTYADPDCEVTVRKAEGENQDISGIYGYDKTEIKEWKNGEQIIYCRQNDSGSEKNSLKITLNQNGYSWSLFAPKGFWGASCEAFLNAIYDS